jgi:ActR/RegA family two-component response regulator
MSATNTHKTAESTKWVTAKDLRVLVVDDDSGVLESIAEAIEDRFKVLTAASGPEALKIVEAEHPEIVLTDQRMSPMTGLELLEKVAAIRPNTRRLLYTGYADIETVVEGLNRDILQRYLTKPWAMEKLHGMLDEAAKLYLQDLDRFEIVSQNITKLRNKLLSHRVYGMLTNIRALQIFTEYHCYPVWDFMSLLKCLQNKLTCTTIPWQTPENMQAARMINEIVVAEETDIRQDGHGHASHYELYVEAMEEIGANTDTLCRFADLIAEGMPYQQAMKRAEVPAPAAEFMSHTLEMCQDHPAYEVAAFFLFGRENLIPDMFRKIVEGLADSEGISIDAFRYYLDRHIGIDEEEHGPASVRMMKSLCGDSDMRWRLVKRAAEESLMARIKLWDGIADAIEADQ